MSKFTADEVTRWANAARADGWMNWHDMLDELARRLRQDEEEMRRDPVIDPRPGDWIKAGPYSFIWAGDAKTDLTGKIKEWTLWSAKPQATVIRRREVQP